jgi:hypothetical protein
MVVRVNPHVASNNRIQLFLTNFRKQTIEDGQGHEVSSSTNLLVNLPLPR